MNGEGTQKISLTKKMTSTPLQPRPDQQAQQWTTQGEIIRSLFKDNTEAVTIIAPFIKRGALQSLLEVIPSDTHIRCVTRWRPLEIAAGVSDPEILDDLEERGSYKLTLVNRLHAKLYIAGERCLVGSSNVTSSGFGDADESNIEVLIATTTDNPGVQATLTAIAKTEQPATRAIAEWTRIQANRLQPHTTGHIESSPWFPRSRRAHDAYRIYKQIPFDSEQYLGAAELLLLGDIARTNVTPGLTEEQFRAEVRDWLRSVPLASSLLDTSDDTTLTKADAQAHLALLVTEETTTNDLWAAFVNWMTHFFPNKVMGQEITEVALRRAQRLR